MILRLRELLRLPLLRLLAINLAIGVAAALVMLGGLVALDAGGLRRLILADRAPVTALALLAFGLVVTFGSVAMGTAIMALGRDHKRSGCGPARRERRRGAPDDREPIVAAKARGKSPLPLVRK